MENVRRELSRMTISHHAKQTRQEKAKEEVEKAQ